MKEPEDIELKQWLCDKAIKGLIVHHYQTGTDTSDTDWELIPYEGKPKRVVADKVKRLVSVDPDWAHVMRVHDRVRSEVDEWNAFVKKEAADLAAYKRLKQKFEK